MSTQLILYPQTYEGEYNSVSTPGLFEYFVDGINFTGINASAKVSLSSPALVSPHIAALLALPPNAVNTWYRYRTTSPGTPDYPTQTGNNLLFETLTTSGDNGSGVYQRLSNLVPGQVYDVTIKLTNHILGTWGSLNVRVFDGNNLSAPSNVIYYNPWPVSYATVLNLSFTALSTQDVLMVSYFHNTAWSVTINSISVKEVGSTPSLIYSELNDGQVICDLYEEEDIPLSLSIDDFKNVAEQVKSYSKDFNLPATKRNNQIFNNMFEITRADDRLIFNPYIRTQCVLKQDGFILFEGYLRMIDVKDKEGEISYNVNLYSDIITLADILKDQTFSQLDFTELEHDYNKTQIQYSWNDSGTGITYLNPSTSGFRDANDTLKYPFINWTGGSFITANTNTASGPTPNNPELPSLEAAFRPCIQLKYLINQIFATSGFNWTSTFFDSADFGKLYMDFNWGSDNAPVVFNSSGELTRLSPDFSIPATYTTLPFDEMTLVNGNSLSADFGYSAGVFTAQEDGQVYTVSYNMNFKQALVSIDTLTVEWLVNGTAVNQATSTSTSFDYAGNFTTPPLSAGDTVLCQAKSPLTLYDLEMVQGFFIANTPALMTVTTSVNQMTNETLLETLRGELGQWDFLKGIMTMFNLVSMVDESNPNNIRIEPYADVFINNTNSGNTGDLTLASRGIQHDWTNKVDVSEMELKPLTDLNKKTQFQFVEDDDDHAFQVYKKATSGPTSSGLYGSKLFDASKFTILEGKKDIIAEPFAATVVKSLFDQFSSFIIPMIYSGNDNGTWEGFDNSPRIFYDNGVKDTGASYYIPAQNGAFSENQTDFLQFSHLSAVPSVSATIDFNFETQQIFTEVGTPTVNNLWSIYWQPYFDELYHADTRIMTLKVNLSPSDVAAFKFYDTVFIKNRTFRVNRIDYKPNDLATVEFILIP